MTESTTRAGTVYKRTQEMEDLDGSITGGGAGEVGEVRSGEEVEVDRRALEEVPQATTSDGGVATVMQILLEER